MFVIYHSNSVHSKCFSKHMLVFTNHYSIKIFQKQLFQNFRVHFTIFIDIHTYTTLENIHQITKAEI